MIQKQTRNEKESSIEHLKAKLSSLTTNKDIVDVLRVKKTASVAAKEKFNKGEIKESLEFLKLASELIQITSQIQPQHSLSKQSLESDDTNSNLHNSKFNVDKYPNATTSRFQHRRSGDKVSLIEDANISLNANPSAKNCNLRLTLATGTIEDSNSSDYLHKSKRVASAVQKTAFEQAIKIINSHRNDSENELAQYIGVIKRSENNKETIASRLHIIERLRNMTNSNLPSRSI